MLSLRKPSLNRVGVLKGAVVATVAFSAGIGVSALVMKQKYEDELNKLIITMCYFISLHTQLTIYTLSFAFMFMV